MDGWIDYPFGKCYWPLYAYKQASLSLHVFVSPLPLYRILGNRETRANLFQRNRFWGTMNIRIHWGPDIGE